MNHPWAVRVARLGAAVAAVFFLSGCYAADLDAEVSEEGTISGTLFVGVATTSPEGNGETNGVPIFDENETKVMFPGSTVESVVTDTGFLGQKVTFRDAPLNYFDTLPIQNALGTRLTITREGTEFVVDGTQNISFITPSIGDGIPEPRVEMSLTFPGEVSATNGEADGRTVTWVNPSTMTARAGASKVFPFQLVGAAVGVTVVLIGGVAYLVRRRKGGVEPVTLDRDDDELTPAKARRLPKRRQPKTQKKRRVVVPEREIVLAPADWWLAAPTPGTVTAPGHDPIELGPATDHEPVTEVRDVGADELEQIDEDVDMLVPDLFTVPDKRRRGR